MNMMSRKRENNSLNENIQIYEDELRSCIEEGDIEKLQKILQDIEIDSNQKMSNGDSLLHIGVRNGQTEIVEFLLNHKASAIACDSDGNIPLHLAVKRNRLSIGKLLLEQQSTEQFYKPNNDGQTTLDLIETNDAKSQWLTLFQRYSRIGSENQYFSEESTPQQFTTSTESDATTFTDDLSRKLEEGYCITPDVEGTYRGKLYQLNTLALLSLRGSENSRPFRLATEVAEFEKFDDAVFDCGGRLHVIQIKYKSTGNKIAKFNIFDKKKYQQQSGKTVFSVEKYLESYWKILETEKSAEYSKKSSSKRKATDFDLMKYFRSYYNFKEETKSIVNELIILTNTIFMQNDNLENYFEEDPLPVDHILFINKHLVKRFKIKESSVSNNPIVREFIAKFRFVLNYPDVDKIEKLIRDQISIKFNKRFSESIANSFFKKLQDWFKDLASKAIDNKMISDIWREIHEKLEIEEIIGASQANFESLYLSNISFTEGYADVDHFLRNESKRVLVISTPCNQLTSARVFRHLKSCMCKDDDFMFTLCHNVKCEENKFAKLIPQIFKLPDVFQILVMLCENELNLRQISDKFLESLENDPKKKIIFIANKVNLDDGVDFDLICELRDDEPSFRCFSEESKEYFMQKYIKFEGRRLKIGQIMSKDVVAEVFSSRNLYQTLISRCEVKIHSDWSYSTQETYIQRKLIALPNFNPDAENSELDPSLCFNENNFYKVRQSERIIVVSGDPGSGKSFLLNNIQRNINQSNNLLWAIKLNLNDFAQDENKENHFIHIDFLETETKKAIEFLSKMVIPQGSRHKLDLRQELTRNLLISSLENRGDERLVPKIVLLFDGFDEISPKCTKKVLHFLRALNRCSIEQMWISTRNHETEEILSGLASPIYEVEIKLNESQFNLVESYLSRISNTNKVGPLKIILRNPELSGTHYDDSFIEDEDYKMPDIVLANRETFQINFFKKLHSHDLKFVEINARISSRRFVSDPLSVDKFEALSKLIKIAFPASENEKINFIEVFNDLSSFNDQQSDSKNCASLKVELENHFTSINFNLNCIKPNFHVKATVKDTKAFSLLNLTKADQSEFVLNYCKVKKSLISSNDVDTKLQNFIQLFRIIDFNHADYATQVCQLFGIELTGFPVKDTFEVNPDFEKLLLIPLFLNMLVQLVTSNQLKSLGDIYLHKIFEKFIELKENIFLKEKQKLGANADECSKATLEKARSCHAKMARSLLLGEMIEGSVDENILYKCGLTVYRSGNLEFLHRSFAEYILVIDLWQGIGKAETQRLLLEKVLVEERFHFVRAIFNSFLYDKREEFALIEIPLSFEVSTQSNNALYVACDESNFNIIKLLLKTLKSGDGSCYEFFQTESPRFNNFASVLLYRNQSEGMKILSDTSYLNPFTLGCITEESRVWWFDFLSSFDLHLNSFHNVLNTFLDYNSIILDIDKSGDGVLHRFDILHYSFARCRQELSKEQFESFLLHRNYAGETYLTMKREGVEDMLSEALTTLDPLDQIFFQRILIEKFNNEGYSVLVHKEIGFCPKNFSIICQYMQLSEDFLIITIYDNLFPITRSLESVLRQFNEILSKFPENNNARELNDLITSIISQKKIDFKPNLVKINKALRAESFDEVERILKDSQGFIREIILACDYKTESVLQNPKIISTFLKHLKDHKNVSKFLVLRIPFKLIEFDCLQSFEFIFSVSWEVLVSLEDSEFHIFLLHYIWNSIRFNRQEILQIILNCIEGSSKLSAEGLLLFGDKIFLRYDVDINPKHEIQNETKDSFLNWLFSAVDDFPDSAIVQLLMFHAEYKLKVSLSETRCNESLFNWLKTDESITIKSITDKSITCAKMHKILFRAARFGFKTIVKNVIDWVESRQSNLIFHMIDVIRYRSEFGKNALHLAARDGLVEKNLNCFEDSNFYRQVRDLLYGKDADGKIFLYEPRNWHDLQIVMNLTIKELGFKFLLSKKDESKTFLFEHCSQEYFIGILLFLKKHASDLEILKKPLFDVLNNAAEQQENFVEIIDIMLKNFKTEFETLLYEQSTMYSSTFHRVLNNKQSYMKILHHLATSCGGTCREALFKFIDKNIDNTSRQYSRIIEFVFKELPEDEVNRLISTNVSDCSRFLVSLQLCEKIFFKILQILNDKILQSDWKKIIRSLPKLTARWSNEGVLKLLSKAIINQEENDLKTFSGSGLPLKRNILHIGFQRGIALETLQCIPKELIKDLLCEEDDYFLQPFSYLSLEEDIEGLVKFLSENLSETDKMHILRRLNVDAFGEFAHQLKPGIENIRTLT